MMDLIEDEPRKQPKPVPFCQSALLQPMVPEVSLLLQDNFHNQSEKKNDSFSGTEFQTYNSWRWKHMNQNAGNKLKNSDSTRISKDPSTHDCYLIKDKYFASETEKRKNEILYGEADEPRRPLPPRPGTIMPASIESFFSNTSFDDTRSERVDYGKPQKVPTHEGILEKKKSSSNIAISKSLKKEMDNSEKLYSIISGQNKQMEVLQNQIDQLLKLQEVKDKQIEQLLNSQELKEKKIEHLMQSLDAKGKEIENLFSLKGKQEQHMQELLRFNELKQKENLNLIKELSEFKEKEKNSIGVMASAQMIDASTCTSKDDIIEQNSNKKTENSVEEEISYIRDNSRLDEKEKSLSLHSSDLPVIQENMPTPQSSIHLDIQDFPDSSDDSETEAGNPGNSLSTDKENQSSPLGYTFYNNILTKVKDIIQNSGERERENNEDKGDKLENKNHKVNKPSANYNFIVENQGAMKSFHSWNVLEKENVPSNFKEQERNERILEQYSNFCLKDTNSPSDISLKINALAMKYLKQEQISQCGLQPQIPNSCQHDVTIYNVTNLSFGSMRYLDRYQMLPQGTEGQKPKMNHPKNEQSPVEFLRTKKRMSIQQNITSTIGNILDISTLNQQPKLL